MVKLAEQLAVEDAMVAMLRQEWQVRQADKPAKPKRKQFEITDDIRADVRVKHVKRVVPEPTAKRGLVLADFNTGEIVPEDLVSDEFIKRVLQQDAEQIERLMQWVSNGKKGPEPK